MYRPKTLEELEHRTIAYAGGIDIEFPKYVGEWKNLFPRTYEYLCIKCDAPIIKKYRVKIPKCLECRDSFYVYRSPNEKKTALEFP